LLRPAATSTQLHIPGVVPFYDQQFKGFVKEMFPFYKVYKTMDVCREKTPT